MTIVSFFFSSEFYYDFDVDLNEKKINTKNTEKEKVKWRNSAMQAHDEFVDRNCFDRIGTYINQIYWCSTWSCAEQKHIHMKKKKHIPWVYEWLKMECSWSLDFLIKSPLLE